MSREELYTIRCDRCGKAVTVNNQAEPPQELKEWMYLDVHKLVGRENPKISMDEDTHAIAFSFFGGKSFDLCKECYLKFRETFLSILPPEILKAFEEKPEEKPKEGGASEQDKKDAPGSDP
jgi:hypothetical protein